MTFSHVKLAAVVMLFSVGVIFTQERFDKQHDGILKGFTRSPTEHIMNEFEGVAELRAVRGRIIEKSSGVGLEEVIVEIRRENPNERVRGVRTRADGSFHMPSVPEGVYMFKVALNGFQSVYGKLTVTKKAPRKNRLIIALMQGV